MAVSKFGKASPSLHQSVFVAPGSWIIGNVEIAAESSVFFGAVVRGDIQPIRIGKKTNIQEHALLHTSHGMNPLEIGEGVTVGHRAILHGCNIEDSVLIGMGATILDNAVIGTQSIIGAHCLVTKETIIPPRSLVYGSPAKIIRQLTTAEVSSLETSANQYVELAAQYKREFPR
jgi:carbonic anhydrase/acetyltransferase-like protein (isoleucine patch superfamily)